MTLLAWLLGFLLPACAATGTNGLAHPALADLAHLQRPVSPNTALAAPASFSVSPDIPTRIYDVPAKRLFLAIGEVAAAQPRTFVAAVYPDALQLHWVARSAAFNFPDLITAQVLPHGAEQSELLLYSRSVFGYGDFGVNRQRLTAWLAALDAAVKSSGEGPSPL